MIVWIALVLFILLVNGLMGDLAEKKSQKNFLIIVGLATFLVMGLRGGDYMNVYDLRVYKIFYETIRDTPFSQIFAISEFEPGYTLLNKVLSVFFPFAQTIVLFEAAFCVFAVCYFIYKNTENTFLSYYFYVTLGSMGFMLTAFRQSIAMCVCLFGVEFIKKKKPIKFLAIALLAYSFHQSALIFFPFYFIAHSRMIMRKKWTLVPIVVLMMIFAPAILDFGKLVSNGEFVAAGEATFTLNGIVPILIYIIGLLLQIRIDDHSPSNKCRTLAPMLAIGLGFYLMRFYNMAIERLAYYYTQASYICIASFFDIVKKDRLLPVMKLLALLLGFVLYFKRLQTADYAAYTFFWN